MTQRGYDIVTMQKLLVVENTCLSLERERRKVQKVSGDFNGGMNSIVWNLLYRMYVTPLETSTVI
jgi:hypothetical protein